VKTSLYQRLNARESITLHDITNYSHFATKLRRTAQN
jgi:hypothetical protein